MKIFILVAGNLNFPDENHIHYSLLANGLANGFQQLGHDTKIISSGTSSDTLRQVIEHYAPDFIFEFNRTRKQAGCAIPEDVPHIAWLHDARLNGKLHVIDPQFGGSDITYTLVTPKLFGFSDYSQLGKCWGILQPGVDERVFYPSADTSYDRELAICGYIPYPLSPNSLRQVFHAWQSRSITWGKLADTLLQKHKVAIGTHDLLQTHKAILSILNEELGLSLSLAEFHREFTNESLNYFDIEVPRILERGQLADAAISSGKRFEIFGVPSWLFWDKYAKHYRDNLTWPSDLAHVFRRTLLTLHNGAFGMHSRVLECMGSGGAIFVNHTDLDDTGTDIGSHFTAGEHYIEYTFATLADDLAHWLSQPEKAREIGYNGAEAIKTGHLWRHRAQRVIDDFFAIKLKSLPNHTNHRASSQAIPFLMKGSTYSWGLNAVDVNLSFHRYRAAETICKGLIEASPDDQRTHFRLGIALLNQGKYAEAEAHFLIDYQATEEKALHMGNLGKEPIRLFRKHFLGDRIGEINKQLDIFMKTERLGWRLPFKAIYPLGKKMQNSCLQSYWEQFVMFSTNQEETDALIKSEHFPEYCTTTTLIPGNRVLYADAAWHHVQHQWENEGRPPLLAISPEHRAHGYRTLNALGMPVEAWFVAFHIRENGYHGDDYSNVRNCQPESYLSAMYAVIEQGGWVVRIGDRSMTPLPPHPHLIDYPFTDAYSEPMDIFLLADCRFLVSSASGPCAIANSFGTPQLQTNLFPAIDRPWSKNDLFLPKLYRQKTTGTLLPFKIVMNQCLVVDDNRQIFDDLDIEVIDNTSDDILAATMEMLAPRLADDSEAHPLRERFDALVLPHFGVVSSRIGATFIKRHQHLLA